MSFHVTRSHTFVIGLFFFFISLAQVPPVKWVKQVQGAYATYPTAMATDPDGNLYTACSFAQKMSIGTQTLYGGGSSSFAVIKCDPLGNYIWSRVVSLGLGHSASSMACDAQGNLYVGGFFAGTAVFGPGKNLTAAGAFDGFVMKLDPAGTLLWAKGMGGTMSDGVTAVSTSPSGELYAAGIFEGNALFDVVNLQSIGSSDVFVARLDPSDGSLNWITRLGDVNEDAARALACDGSGNVFVAGSFSVQSNFGPGTFNAVGFRDGFVAALETQGGSPQWAEQIGGKGDDEVSTLITDSQGEVYSSGFFGDTLSYGGSTLIAQGYSNVFVIKNDGNGGSPLFAKKLGGKGNYQRPWAMSRGPGDKIYLTGQFDGTLTATPSSFVSAGDVDAFLCELDVQGTVQWADQKGGISGDVPFALSADVYGNIYTGGRFSETFQYGPSQLDLPGAFGGFIARWGDYLAPGETALDEQSGAGRLAVFPNPFKDRVEVLNTGKRMLHLHDISGRTLLEQQVQNTATLNLENLAPGVYYLRLTEAGGASRVARLVKE